MPTRIFVFHLKIRVKIGFLEILNTKNISAEHFGKRRPLCFQNFRVHPFSSCFLNDHIYAMGGMDGHSRLKNVERYNVIDKQWEQLPDMNERRSDASAASCATNNR